MAGEAQKAAADDLVLKVDDRELTGWTRVEVTRSLEQMPNSFVLEATEASPLYVDAVAVKAGQPCTIALGGDLVITGYVDGLVAGYGPGYHTVQIQGRGKCQDLVDCSAEWKGCQISGANALEIAEKLAAPYGISVAALDDVGGAVPQFNINIGNTPADILELVTRHAALLYYEGPDGNLILAQAASTDAGSGFVEGENVQAAAVLRSVAQRYSHYTCSLLSMDTSGVFEDNDGLFFFTAEDPNIGRNRKLYSVAEGVMGGLQLAEARAKWDASRRAGRGAQVSVTVDSWRDGEGALWAPNTLAPVSLPRLKMKDAQLCIARVIYRFDLATGRTAEVFMMPREAFLPEPVQLQPVIPGLTPADQADADGG